MGCTVLRYSGGILGWTKEELENIDRKSKRALHPRANVASLYLPRNTGGRRSKQEHENERQEKRKEAGKIKLYTDNTRRE